MALERKISLSLMCFCDALLHLKAGARVARSEWPAGRFLYIFGGRILFYDDGIGSEWLPGSDVLLAEDWRLLPAVEMAAVGLDSRLQ